jgi:hypothetical protein
MPKSCIICSAAASPDLKLQHCAQCKSALYCSTTCQRKDWGKEHRQLCRHLNVGHGDMQVPTEDHLSRSKIMKETLEKGDRSLDEDMKRFFKLYTESTFEGSRAVAREMKKIAKRQIKHNQKILFYYGVGVLGQSDSKMLSWPNSPLLVMLHFFDPSEQSGDEEMQAAPFHFLADLADPFECSTHGLGV